MLMKLKDRNSPQRPMLAYNANRGAGVKLINRLAAMQNVRHPFVDASLL